MHTLLALSVPVLITLAGVLVLRRLRDLESWEGRRQLQMLVLAAPALGLGASLGSLLHFVGRACFSGAPPWDHWLGIALPLGMAAVALGALALGLVRLAIAHRVLADRGRPAHGWLQAIAEKLAERLGTPRPQVLVCPLSRPLALASGLRRPTILLSTWTLDHLDRREIEAVVAHELGHIAHRDCPAAWLATVLRDAFCYLPASRAAYQHLQHEKELACDDLAVHITHRPLALASALAKVWQPGLAANRRGTLQPFEGAAGSVEERIERLLAYTAPSVAPGPSPRRGLRSLRLAAPMLASMAGLQAASVALFLAPMGCGPAVALANVL